MSSDSEAAYPGKLFISEYGIVVYITVLSGCVDSWIMFNKDTKESRFFFSQQRKQAWQQK